MAETVLRYGIIQAVQILATDETGVSGQTGRKESVIEARKKGLHYQHAGGSRENTTVLVTIRANGTSIVPCVVFKGKAHNLAWAQFLNPAHAS